MAFPATIVEGPNNQINWAHLGSYFIIGVGTPEGFVKGRVGAIFVREDGEPGKTIYVKEKGEGTDEGWTAFEGSTEGGFVTVAELLEEAEAREEADLNEAAARSAADSALTTSVNERVKGPGSAVDGDIAVFDGATGKLVKDGLKTIAQVLVRANHTGTQLASTVSDFDTQVRTSRLDQMATPTANVPWGEKKLTKLADPTEALDAANKEYVDAAASAAAAGLSLKNPVSYATTAALTVTAETEKTLEGTAPLTTDGKTPPPIGARLLIKNQASEKQNGLYEVTKNEAFGGEGEFGGGGKFGEGSKWLLTRTADADTEAEVKQGMFVFVTLGTTNTSTTWTLTTENPIVIGTTAQTFGAFTAQPVGPAGGDFEGTFPNPAIKKEVIVNEDVSPSAAIAYSKLNLSNSIKGSDVVAGTLEGSDLNANAKNLFLQLPETAARILYFGRVTAAGEKKHGSAGWTVEKTALGKYTITLTSELPNPGELMLTVAATAGFFNFATGTAAEEAKKTFTYETRSSAGALENLAVYFYIIG